MHPSIKSQAPIAIRHTGLAHHTANMQMLAHHVWRPTRIYTESPQGRQDGYPSLHRYVGVRLPAKLRGGKMTADMRNHSVFPHDIMRCQTSPVTRLQAKEVIASAIWLRPWYHYSEVDPPPGLLDYLHRMDENRVAPCPPLHPGFWLGSLPGMPQPHGKAYTRSSPNHKAVPHT